MTHFKTYLYVTSLSFILSTNAMEKNDLIQVCTNGVCKWVPIKQVVEKSYRTTQESKSILSSTFGFIADHPKGVLYGLGTLMGLTSLIWFVKSDYYWETPEHARQLRRRILKNFFINKHNLLHFHKMTLEERKRKFSILIAQHDQELKKIDKHLDNLETTLNDLHKKRLEQDKNKLARFTHELNSEVTSVHNVIQENVQATFEELRSELGERRKKFIIALGMLKKEQSEDSANIDRGFEQLYSIRGAFQPTMQKSIFNIEQITIPSSIDTDYKSVKSYVDHLNSNLQQIEDFANNVELSEEDLFAIEQKQAEMKASVFNVKKQLGMVPCSPGGFPLGS